MAAAWPGNGQQRAVALSKSSRAKLAIPINAFVADEVNLQRDQFLRVNNTKPLPRGLITELLPEVSTILPVKMAAKRIPSAICDWLSRTPKSPFFGLVRRASTPENQPPTAVIADASIVRMVEESLSSPSGCLFPFRNMATGETDFDGINNLLVVYWSAGPQGVRQRLGQVARNQPLDARGRHPSDGPIDGPGHAGHRHEGRQSR